MYHSIEMDTDHIPELLCYALFVSSSCLLTSFKKLTEGERGILLGGFRLETTKKNGECERRSSPVEGHGPAHSEKKREAPEGPMCLVLIIDELCQVVQQFSDIPEDLLNRCNGIMKQSEICLWPHHTNSSFPERFIF